MNHRLAINIRIVNPIDVQPSTHFLADVRLLDGKGSSIFVAIKKELETRGIPLEKVYGLYFINNGTIKTSVLRVLFCCIMYAFTKVQLKKLTHSLQKGRVRVDTRAR